MLPFTRNDLIGLADLFRLAAKNRQAAPGQVMVLLPVEDCERLAEYLPRLISQ
jgi:hypothetical protein